MASGLRTAEYATTTRSGFRTDILPWRLYQKAKRLAWDPVELDLAQDAPHWEQMNATTKRMVARLATIFMAGEEAVTLDIVPMLRAVSDEGRVEETMFLTTFLGEEAKHAELFRRWFDAIGWDESLDQLLPETYHAIFDTELPRAMRRLDSDRSPEAILDAALVYNQFVEGVLAMTGYWTWQRIFEAQGTLPGIRAGLQLVQRDERRHIAYGTYLCRRTIAANPDLWGFVERRMAELEALGMTFVTDLGSTILRELAEMSQEAGAAPAAGATNGGQDPQSFASIAGEVLMEFTEYGRNALHRRLKVIEVAKDMSVEQVDGGHVEEDLESELQES